MEELTAVQKFNEYIMTSIRTKWGVSPAKIRRDFGEKAFFYFLSCVAPYIRAGQIEEKEGVYTLGTKGKLFADGISAALFMDDD
jgi:oxygen-independent coproporphyrinogen-3 oxidase